MYKIGDKVRVINSHSNGYNNGKTGRIFLLSKDPDDEENYVAVEADVGFFKDQEGLDARFGMFFRSQDLEKI
jgi:hypothetical protein